MLLLSKKSLWKRKSWIMLVVVLLLASKPSDFNVTNLFLLWTVRDQCNSSVHFLENSFKNFSGCPSLLLHLSLVCSIPNIFLDLLACSFLPETLQRKPRALAPVNHRHDVILPRLLHYFFSVYTCIYILFLTSHLGEDVRPFLKVGPEWNLRVVFISEWTAAVNSMWRTSPQTFVWISNPWGTVLNIYLYAYVWYLKG